MVSLAGTRLEHQESCVSVACHLSSLFLGGSQHTPSITTTCRSPLPPSLHPAEALEGLRG